MIKIIISIREKHWNNILSGRKTLELRKSFPEKAKFIQQNNELTKKCEDILCYVWVPEKKYIAGTFTTNGYDLYSLTQLHKFDDFTELFEQSCVAKEFIENYLSNGKKVLYTWHIKNVIEIKEKLCNLELLFGIKRPPQSWCYIKEKENKINGTDS